MSLGANMNLMDKILIFLCAGIGGPLIGLICGRFASAWFPFRLTKGLYLPIRNVRFQKLLISDETCHWGRARPKELPEKYYRVSPGDREKMCVWGLLFFVDWFLLLILCILIWFNQFPEVLRPFLLAASLALPLLIFFDSLDFLAGAYRAMKAENLNPARAKGQLTALFFLALLVLSLLGRLWLASRNP